jgi:hypothetical protein
VIHVHIISTVLPDSDTQRQPSDTVSPPRSSVTSVDREYGPLSVTLVFEDGNIFMQPTWPSVTVQLLRRQVATSLTCRAETIFFA